MSNQFDTHSSFVNSVIGEGTRFRGELELNGILRIDGDFSGSIRTLGKVLIGKNGRVESTIKASSIVVGGVVKGNLYADEKVVILSTGLVIGNITSPKIVVEEGVILHGVCSIRGGDSPRKKDGSSPLSGVRRLLSRKKGEESAEQLETSAWNG